MRVIVGVVGRPRNRALAEAIREYETRAARYWPIEVHEVREEGARAARADEVMRREGERLRARVGSARLVACDALGTAMDSARFAAWLQTERERAQDIAIVIGGAYGLAPDIREQAVTRLSLSGLTMSHELARLVLAEQLYRAGTIVRGEPYHK